MLLDNLRKTQKLTQQKMADLLNVKKSTYCLYENGKRQPALKTVVKMSTIFNCPIDIVVNALIEAQDKSLNKKRA